MPQVDITVVGPAPRADQKQALFEQITNLMVDVLGRQRPAVVVSLTHVEPADWSVGGVSPNGAGVAAAQAVIRIIAGSNSDDQKARMIAEATRVLSAVLGESKLPLYVTFHETAATSWGFNGRTVAELQKAQAKR